jgi:hypothetical protein
MQAAAVDAARIEHAAHGRRGEIARSSADTLRSTDEHEQTGNHDAEQCERQDALPHVPAPPQQRARSAGRGHVAAYHERVRDDFQQVVFGRPERSAAALQQEYADGSAIAHADQELRLQAIERGAALATGGHRCSDIGGRARGFCCAARALGGFGFGGELVEMRFVSGPPGLPLRALSRRLLSAHETACFPSGRAAPAWRVRRQGPGACRSGTAGTAERRLDSVSPP